MTKREFKNEVNEIAVVAVNRANKFLSNLDLSLSINWEYEFDGGDLSDAIGVYEGGSVFEGNISISCNLKTLYAYFVKNVKDYPWSDPYTILNEMISTNVYHEMGHGIVEYIGDYLHETDELDGLYDSNQELFDYIFDNEEDAVEHFAWCMYDNKLDESELYKVVNLYLGLYGKRISEMRISNDRMREIIREEIDALDFFNGINNQNGGLTPWDAETKMDRMQPSNASRSYGNVPTKEFKIHSYQDWLKNYKGKGISYSDYIEMDI